MPDSADTDDIAAASRADASISPVLVQGERVPEHPNSYACLAAAQGMASVIAAAEATVASALARDQARSMHPKWTGMSPTQWRAAHNPKKPT